MNSHTEEAPPAPRTLHHHLRRMTGRDPHETGRVATPLELLFDLTFVASFAAAAVQLAHALAEGHVGAALFGFSFASFAICWAWINFSWFASAYDTDDWAFRLTTMVQMIGVVILSIGLPRMFHSIVEGHHPDNSVMVLGYVIMRVAMLTQWLRATRDDPKRRRATLTFVLTLLVAQIGWIVLIFTHFSLTTTVLCGLALMLIEMAGPVLAESKDGGTPWHPHHIAERYSLFAIIALGETVVGTIATLNAVTTETGWTLDAALIGVAGMGFTFGIWWMYYMLPSGEVLHAHRERSFVWGYAHMIPIVAIVATGAGLDVAAYYIADKAKLDAMGTALTIAIPLGIFMISIFALYAYLVRRLAPTDMLMLIGSLAVLAIGVLCTTTLPFAWCALIMMLAPFVTVIGFESFGHRHQQAALDAMVRHGG